MGKFMYVLLKVLFSGLITFGLAYVLMLTLPTKIFTVLFICLGGWYFGTRVSDFLCDFYDENFNSNKDDGTDVNGNLPVEEVDWNDGYIIEGLDRCYNIRDIIQSQLLCHPAVLRAGQEDKVKEAIMLIGRIYLSIGTIQCEGEENDKSNKE